MRAALYGRVSKADGSQDCENQMAQLREFALRSGWEVAVEYVDTVSGSGVKVRPQFDAMMANARVRQFDVLLFWSLDRLSREGVLQTLKYLESLKAAGVGWKSYTEQYLDSLGVFADAVLAILAAVAKQERLRISERTKAGLDRARRAGRVGGRRTVLTPSVLREIRQLREKGWNFSQIEREVGVSHQVVSKACKEMEAA